MLRQALGKIGQTLVVLFIVSVATFGLLKLAPGDPVQIMLGSEYSPEAYEQLTIEMGLDRPFLTQYIDWATNFVTGDWGTSFVARTDIFLIPTRRSIPNSSRTARGTSAAGSTPNSTICASARRCCWIRRNGPSSITPPRIC